MTRRKTSSSKKAAKVLKPTPQLVHAITSLQALVQDEDSWSNSLEAQLYSLETSLSKLEKLQSSLPFRNVIPTTRTTADFDLFSKWLLEHNINLSDRHLRLAFANHARTVAENDSHVDDNATLFATEVIPEDDILVSVPSKLMLTSLNTAARPSLSSFAAAVPAVAMNASLSLVLSLLTEASDENSFYKAYINTLPKSHNIPFATFSARDMVALSPSRAAKTAINTLRAQVRDYTYVFQAVTKHRPEDLPLSVLSFSNWRWAVSIIMTRQNSLPVPDSWGGGKCAANVMALVPLWDMCNHELGKLSTAVMLNDDDLTVECRAMRTFQVDEAVTMFYGKRPNIQLALYSGFVHDGNQFDVVPISVIISKEIPFAVLKARALAKKGIMVQEGGGTGWACLVDIGIGINNIDKAIAVATVSVMGKDEMTAFLKSEDELPDVTGDNGKNRSALELVEQAVLQKLKQYEESEASWTAEERSRSTATRLVDALHHCEKTLLTDALQAVRQRCDTDMADGIGSEDDENVTS